MPEETYEHVVEAWTVGQLRAVLDGLPDDLPLAVDVADEPGGDTAGEQVVVGVGFAHGTDATGQPFVDRALRIGCEFPTGTYSRRT